MNRSKAEFVKRWQGTLAAGFLFGMVADTRESTLQRGTKALDIPEHVADILGKMWEDDEKLKEAAKPAVNGQTAQTTVKR